MSAERETELVARVAELEAQVASVRALADEWDESNEGSEDWRVFGPQVLSVPFAVKQLRAALASAAPAVRPSDGEGASGEAPFECTTFLPQDPNVRHVDRERCHVDRPHQSHEHTKGLFGKYRVERIYDPNGKHADCRYFVLDPQHDPLARVALAAYADAAKDAGLDTLTGDLRGWLLVTP